MSQSISSRLNLIIEDLSKDNPIGGEVVHQRDKNFSANVKKDPNTINKSGQARSASDEEDQKIMNSGQVELDSVVSKINAIRAGRSLKDEDILSALSEYFESLDDAERVALFAYMKGISEVVSGQKPGDVATEPSDPDPRVSMKRNDRGEDGDSVVVSKPKITTKANVAAKPPNGGPGPSGLDAPLSAKKR